MFWLTRVDWLLELLPSDWSMACGSLYLRAIRYRPAVKYLSPCPQTTLVATGNPLIGK